MSKRRSCISRSDKREERPGSPERPRTLAPPGSPSGSRGKVGIERPSATRGGRGSAGAASSLDGIVFSDSADCETFIAELGIRVEAPFGASAFRRLRPPRRPLRRRCLSGVAADPPADDTGASWAGGSPAGVGADSSATEFSTGTCAGSGVRANEVSPASWDALIAESCPPSLTAASCAFVFQSALRKRSAAARYHFAASKF